MPDANKAFNILTINQISPVGLKNFPPNYYHIGNDLANPNAILVRSHNMHAMEIPESVIAIGRAGAGTNNVPVDTMNQRGIPVFNTPGANANAVKELVLASILLAARNLTPALNFINGLQGDDAALHKQAEDGKKRFSGIELPGRTLGIIGLGEIGRLVADAALKLGMKVVGFDPNLTVDAAWNLSSDVKKAQSIEELLRQSEFITLHVPLLDATRHMINENCLKDINPDSILLNFSRDGIVEENTILAGIEAKKIKYYICDFPSQKLQHQKAVITLPHLGASTLEAEENCAVMAARQLRDYLENGNVINSVNFPTLSLDRSSGYRLAISNRNVPNMLGSITSTLADHDINVIDLLNKSRDDIAYNLIDVEPQPTATAIAQLEAIDGVIAVRLL